MRPFEGIRVLDMTHVLAGPFSTCQLAALGADVIKIESPDNPDMTRHEGVDEEENSNLYGSYFQAQNAGKRSLVLDLKSARAQEVLWKLVDTADVLVQNYAGDALKKLGFGEDAVRARNERIIYCTISGYGRTGPKRNHPAYDVVIQAFSGVMAANGEGRPVRVGPPMVDYGTGAQAALAISAALYQRTITGLGQGIDVAMLDAALMLSSASVVDTTATGQAPKVHGNAHESYAGYATYACQDGELMIGAWTNAQLAALFDVLGEPARAEQVRATPRAQIGQRLDEDTALIARHMRIGSAAQWEERLNSAHIPAARVRTLEQTLIEPQVASRAVLQQASNGSGPTYPVAAFSYSHGSPAFDRPPPVLGAHTAEILAELGIDASQSS